VLVLGAGSAAGQVELQVATNKFKRSGRRKALDFEKLEAAKNPGQQSRNERQNMETKR